MSRHPVSHIGHEQEVHLAKSVWHLDQLLTFLVPGEATNGAFTLIRCTGRQGSALPLHIHHGDDETIYMLEGAATVDLDDQQISVTPGDCILIARGTAHRVTVETPQATLLMIYVPARFEGFFHDLSEPAQHLGLPPTSVASPDTISLGSLAAMYGCEILSQQPLEER
jgi:quercetin dioxygenase-like cupin family protein